ncbi:PrsW family intramembrane metalloprotease [Streptomyces microflavus]|uniref:PrsW family intramembrane metalloprotease n=1 Tax=Streptomyces microflavus TaxID=1919 RepID=UPI00365C61CC
MITTGNQDLEAARATAINASGWGTPFKVVQLRNACFWVLLCGLAAGALQMLYFYRPGIGAYQTGLGVGVIAFALYTVPWLLLLAHHNKYTTLPAKLFTGAFAWGALAAAFAMALNANDALLSLYGKAFGHAWASDWAAGLTAPFTEETAKATALILLIGLAPRLIRSPFDGLMIGAFAGLGFQILEDVLYAYNGAQTSFGADQAGTAAKVVLVRALSGLTGHVLFSAVFCAGLMWLIGRGRTPHRLRGALLMAAAMITHGLWDNAASVGTALAGNFGPVLVLALLPVAALLLLWLTFRLAAPQEQQWMRDILAPEVAAGILTDTEVDAAGGGRARRAYRKTLPGRTGRKTGRHLITAATDLAQQLALSHGRTSDGVTHARNEITRLRTTS